MHTETFCFISSCIHKLADHVIYQPRIVDPHKCIIRKEIHSFHRGSHHPPRNLHFCLFTNTAKETSFFFGGFILAAKRILSWMIR